MNLGTTSIVMTTIIRDARPASAVEGVNAFGAFFSRACAGGGSQILSSLVTGLRVVVGVVVVILLVLLLFIIQRRDSKNSNNYTCTCFCNCSTLLCSFSIAAVKMPFSNS